MEGTVTISIREYERLKDLPHTVMCEKKELQQKYDLVLANQPEVRITIEDRNKYMYKVGNYIEATRIYYQNLDEFKKEHLDEYIVKVSNLQNVIKDLDCKIALLENKLNQPKEKKKKRFWLF